MPLVLKPELANFNRKQIEDHIGKKRIRRMSAAQVYYEGVKGKYQHQSDQIARKWLRTFDLLKKDLDAWEKAEEKVNKRLVDIGEFEHGYALVEDLIDDLEK